MSSRITWVRGKMFFPPDVNPADCDWEPLLESRNTCGFCMDSTILNVRIPNPLAARVAEHKKKTQVPTLALVRRAIEEALKKEETTK